MTKITKFRRRTLTRHESPPYGTTKQIAASIVPLSSLPFFSNNSQTRNTSYLLVTSR